MIALNIRNCKECGKLFQYDGVNKICYGCRKQDEEDFKRVKEFLYENPKETVTVVSEETEVCEEKILRYLRQGKLEITGDSPGILLDCESCGKAIRTGRFCEKCAHDIGKGFRSGFDRREKSSRRDGSATHKMYITEIRKKRR